MNYNDTKALLTLVAKRDARIMRLVEIIRLELIAQRKITLLELRERRAFADIHIADDDDYNDRMRYAKRLLE